VLVEAVGVGLGHHRGEVAVEHRPVAGGVRVERQVLVGVVADREQVVVAGLEEAVELPALELDPAALVGVVGVLEAAAVRRREVVRLVPDPLAVDVAQPRLLAVRPLEPAEVVVEGAVLPHHEHDVLDAGVRGGGEGGGRARGQPAGRAGGGGDAGDRRSSEQMAARDAHAGSVRFVGLRVTRSERVFARR
jgi:hypothetical protein